MLGYYGNPLPLGGEPYLNLISIYKKPVASTATGKKSNKLTHFT
jgi:hypothetical protein